MFWLLYCDSTQAFSGGTRDSKRDILHTVAALQDNSTAFFGELLHSRLTVDLLAQYCYRVLKKCDEVHYILCIAGQNINVCLASGVHNAARGGTSEMKNRCTCESLSVCHAILYQYVQFCEIDNEFWWTHVEVACWSLL